MMRNQPTSQHFSFHHLHTLFEGAANNLQLKASAGKGSLQMFEIEPGLQARLWNCTFENGLELFCAKNAEDKDPYFTLAYFLNKEGLQFANNHTLFEKNKIWDTLFISSDSHLRMYVPPATPVVCLNISFSKNWLQQHLLSYTTEGKVEYDFLESTPCAHLTYMEAEEKKLLQKLIQEEEQKELGTLQSKSIVLNMLANFLHKLKEKTTLQPTHYTMNDLLNTTENMLCSSVKGSMPPCDKLARQYGFSVVSLKRHFKEKYGVNMSTYFMNKKMEYAQAFMRLNRLSKGDAARKLGYKNISHFTTMFQKYAHHLQLDTTHTRKYNYRQVV